MGGAPNPVQGWLGACAGNNGTQRGLEPRASKLQAGRRKHCQQAPSARRLTAAALPLQPADQRCQLAAPLLRLQGWRPSKACKAQNMRDRQCSTYRQQQRARPHTMPERALLGPSVRGNNTAWHVQHGTHSTAPHATAQRTCSSVSKHSRSDSAAKRPLNPKCSRNEYCVHGADRNRQGLGRSVATAMMIRSAAVCYHTKQQRAGTVHDQAHSCCYPPVPCPPLLPLPASSAPDPSPSPHW